MTEGYYDIVIGNRKLGRIEKSMADTFMKKHNLSTLEELLFCSLDLYFNNSTESRAFKTDEDKLNAAIKDSEIIIAGHIQVFKDLCDMLSPYIANDIVEREPFETCGNCANCHGQLCVSDMSRIDPLGKGCLGWEKKEEQSSKVENILTGYYKETSPDRPDTGKPGVVIRFIH